MPHFQFLLTQWIQELWFWVFWCFGVSSPEAALLKCQRSNHTLIRWFHEHCDISNLQNWILYIRSQCIRIKWPTQFHKKNQYVVSKFVNVSDEHIISMIIELDAHLRVWFLPKVSVQLYFYPSFSLSQRKKKSNPWCNVHNDIEKRSNFEFQTAYLSW